MIAIIDNYDSFTYNLVQRLGELDPSVDLRVFRNDKVTVDELEALAPTRLIVSPGPGTPLDGGISSESVLVISALVSHSAHRSGGPTG